MPHINDSGERRYGCWAGNPDGMKEDPARCIAPVWTRERWSLEAQCHRKRGHGPDGLYCKQHVPETVKA